MSVSTILVALTSLDPSGEQLLDALAAEFPVSALRGSPHVWLVEVEEETSVEHAVEEVGRSLTGISDDWQSAIRIGAEQRR